MHNISLYFQSLVTAIEIVFVYINLPGVMLFKKSNFTLLLAKISA